MSIFADVGAELRLSGESQFHAGMNRAAGAAEHVSGAFDQLAHSGAGALAGLGRGVAGVIDHMAMLAAGAVAAKVAIAGAFSFHAIHQGLATVNNSVEQSKIGFASLFNMFGAVPDIGSGLGMAAELMAGIRKDAAALPGETQDFVSMAQVLTGPLLQAGKGMKEIRDLTRDTVVAAASLTVPFEVASREMGMMLAGSVSSHMPLAAKLGINAHTMVKGKTFHDASREDRFDFITEKLKKAKDSLPLFEQSWSGLTSTMSDKWHMFLGKATEPLFGRVKGSMIRIIGWVDTHQQQIDHVAERVGTFLANSWLRVEDAASRIPTWIEAARDAWDDWSPKVHALADALVSGFEKAWPYVLQIGNYLGEKLEHPVTSLKELVALRAAAGGAQMLPGVVGMGGALAQMFRGGGAVGAAAGGTEKAIERGVMGGIRNVAEYGIGGASHEADVQSALAFGGNFFNPSAPVGGWAAGGAAGGEGAAAAGFATVGAGTLVGIVLAEIAAAAVAIFDNVGGVATNIRDAVSTTMVDVVALFSSLAEKGGLFRDVLGAAGAVVVQGTTNAVNGMNRTLEATTGVVDNMSTAWQRIKLLWADTAAESEQGFTAVDVLTTSIGLLGRAVSNINFPLLSFINTIDEWGQKLGLWSASGGLGKLDTSVNKYADMGQATLLQPSAERSWEGDPKNKRTVQPAAHVDARGSKIEIKFDARNESPDRLAMRLFDAVGHALAKPIASSYAPARAY